MSVHFTHYIEISVRILHSLHVRTEYYTELCVQILYSYMCMNRILRMFMCNNVTKIYFTEICVLI